MYPDFHFLLKDLFGLDIPVLSLLKTFGFLVAMGFLVAGYIISKELKRKEDNGLIQPTIEDVVIGKPATIMDYIINGLIGFLIGFKILGMFANWQVASPDPMSYLFSSNGSLWLGIAVMLATIVLKIKSSKKEGQNGIQTKKIKTHPHQRVGDIAVIAAIGGFAGAKIFNAFETWEDFLSDPLGNLLSSSGLTFYGGLIVATIALWVYSRKIKLDFRYLCDAAAPALI